MAFGSQGMKKLPFASEPMKAADGKSESDAPLSSEIRACLGDAGLVAVPLNPTTRMLEAGSLAGNGDPALARAIFAAMMDAADP